MSDFDERSFDSFYYIEKTESSKCYRAHKHEAVGGKNQCCNGDAYTEMPRAGNNEVSEALPDKTVNQMNLFFRFVCDLCIIFRDIWEFNCNLLNV